MKIKRLYHRLTSTLKLIPSFPVSLALGAVLFVGFFSRALTDAIIIGSFALAGAVLLTAATGKEEWF